MSSEPTQQAGEQVEQTQDRVVKHALFEYTDGSGVRKIALRGQQVRVSGADLARGEAHGAFLGEGESLLDPAAPLVAASTAVVTAPEVTKSPEDPAVVSPGDPEPLRPMEVAPKGVWVDYAVSKGADRKTAEAMSKAQLAGAYPPSQS